MMAHTYSDALRAVAPHLAQHRRGWRMLRRLAHWERYTDSRDGFATAAAVYWVATAWHGGQSCPLYAALSALVGGLRYSPGPLSTGPDCEVSRIMHAELDRMMLEGGA